MCKSEQIKQACKAFTVTEFCDSCKIARNTAYAEIKAGRLKAKQIGRKKLITAEAADAWLNALPDALMESEV